MSASWQARVAARLCCKPAKMAARANREISGSLPVYHRVSTFKTNFSG